VTGRPAERSRGLTARHFQGLESRFPGAVGRRSSTASPLRRLPVCSNTRRSDGRRAASPQISRFPGVHTLGTSSLSRTYPQPVRTGDDQGRSTACGIVRDLHPQAVDRENGAGEPPDLSTGGPQARARYPQLVHSAIHCSATEHALSLGRVKGVTSSPRIGLWARWVNLGTQLGRSGRRLCMGCAELSAVHSEGELSTVRAHRAGGQKTVSDLRQWRYPRFPQPLLLLPHRVSWESASKWGLCVTRPGPARRDLTKGSNSCQCGRSDWSPASFLRRRRREPCRQGQQGAATAGGGLR
jgi:hypothetical protein